MGRGGGRGGVGRQAEPQGRRAHALGGDHLSWSPYLKAGVGDVTEKARRAVIKEGGLIFVLDRRQTTIFF